MPKRKSKTDAAAPSRSGKSPWLALLIAGATVALFWSSTRFGFVNLDDDLYVSENPHVANGLNLASLRYAFTTTHGGSWMPLTWLSLLLDRAFWGNTAVGFHATNILLHALSAGLLFLALARMSRETWPAALAAALFAVHPLRLESVVWIAERKDVLSAFFFMFTLVAYARYAEQPGRKRMALTLTCLASGLMAKPMLVTTPFLLLLLDVWPLRRIGTQPGDVRQSWRRLLAEKIPMFIVALAFAALTFFTQTSAGAVLADAEAGPQRILRIADNCVFYLGKLFWPQSLNVLYPITPLRTGAPLLALGLLVAISLAALRSFPKRPWLTVGWFWFLVALFPVCGVVPIGSTWVADRYSYLPSIGIAVALAWAIWTLTPATRPCRQIATLFATMLVVSLMAVTVRNLPRWRDSIALFSDAVSKGEHPGAYQNLGAAIAARGDHPLAIKNYSRALELNPASCEALYNRGNSFQALGETARALDDYSHAIELRADYAAYNNRGNLHAERGEFQQAIGDFTQAIALRPADTDVLINRAHALLELGRNREAIEDYSKAIASRLDFASAYHDRAVAYLQIKDYDHAWEDIRCCRRLGLTPNLELIRRLENGSGKIE